MTSMNTIEEVVDEAYRLLEKPLLTRDMSDLQDLELIKVRLSKYMPYAKKAFQEYETKADTLEKKTILEWKQKKALWWEVKVVVKDIEAYARTLKNAELLVAYEKERVFNTISNAYKELDWAIVNTRINLRLMP